jgi:hypothetical protein
MPNGITPMALVVFMTLNEKPTYNISKVFFDWTDLDYRKFMIQLCSFIEPRYERKDTYILEEFDEAQEILFIHKGKSHSLNKRLVFLTSLLC